MHSDRAKHNLFAVSANNAEAAINTERATDTTLLLNTSDVLNLEPRRESNEDEQNGKEEVDAIYDLGGLANLSANFDKAQCQHIAFLCAYGLGTIVTIAAGAGYLHTITPISGQLDEDRSNPSFTAAYRYGDSILKRRLASMFVDSFSVSFNEDDWVKASGTFKGTGKATVNVIEESVSAAENVVVLSPAANGVHGATAEARLDNVHSIIAETAADVWERVEYSAVSDAIPGVITITAPGVGTDEINYKILYVPTEEAWCSFPAKISETPLRVSETQVNLGGAWNGAAFVGGVDISKNVKSIEYSCSNNHQLVFGFGAGGVYASKCKRDGRQQTLKLNKEFKDYVLQNKMDKNEYFGIRILAEGGPIDGGNNYQVEFIFPMVGVLNAPISADGKTLAEAGDLTVMEHATYGSVIAKIKNEVATYAV